MLQCSLCSVKGLSGPQAWAAPPHLQISCHGGNLSHQLFTLNLPGCPKAGALSPAIAVNKNMPSGTGMAGVINRMFHKLV